MRRFLLLVIASAILVACAEDPTPIAPATSPEPTVDPIVEARVDIYESLTRELVRQERVDWRRIVIASRLCGNAGDAEEAEGCDDALSAAEQDELARRLEGLAPRISFVEDPTSLYDEQWFSGAPRMIVVRLGTIVERNDGVEVGGSFGCGGLCGSGTTYLLDEADDGWEVTGTTGPMWIA